MNDNTPKTLDELFESVLTVFPDADFGEDNDGQIIIYTGVTVPGPDETEIIPFQSQN